MRNSRYASLMAVGMLAAVSAGMSVRGMPLRSAGEGNNRRPTPPPRNTALEREIADHNAAVDARNAEKRDRKMARKAAAQGKP